MHLQTLEMLEKKEKLFLKKAADEVEKAKAFASAKNKRGILQIISQDLFLQYFLDCIALLFVLPPKLHCWNLKNILNTMFLHKV